MGLTAPSIYNAFGDKQELFKRALEQYIEHTTRERLRRLEEELPPSEAITQFFAEIIDHSIKDSQRKGCFLVNSALEVAPHNTKSARSSPVSSETSRHSSANAFSLAKRIG